MSSIEQKFQFKEIDQEGLENLSAIESATVFNEWMFDTIAPFCIGKILEIGSGIGNISTFFIQNNADITLSDIRENYCIKLRDKFPNQNVLQINITDLDFDIKMASEFGKYDSIFALNVVEHIEYDSLAMKNIQKLLKTGGKAIILVPAYQQLYNRLDVELEHFKRYTTNSLFAIFKENDFQIVHNQYFNAMGIPAWFISGKLQKNKTIPKNQMKLYNALVPVFKFVDKILCNKFGLSVIVVGQKI